MKEVIIISTHNTGLGLIRIFGESQIPVIALYYDKKDMGYVSKFVKKSIYVPHPEKEKVNFINKLLELKELYRGSLLIPADDSSVVTVSKNKKMLQDYFEVAISDWSLAEKFINKKYTYEIAESIGIPTPKSLVPESLEDVKAFSREINYPTMIKPSQSHLFFDIFKVKMFKVHSYEELLSSYKKAVKHNLEVIIQEYIPGDETNGANYNSYYYDDNSLIEFTSKKVRLSPRESGAPSVVISKDIPEIKEMSRKLLREMNFCGYSCTEFKRDVRDGIYKLMEVNGRHNRSTLLAYKCGLNFPLIQYEHLMDGKKKSYIKYKKDVYWIDIAKDLFVCHKYLIDRGYSFKKWISPYFKEKIFATYNSRDLKPFIKRVFDIFKMILNIILKKK